MYRVNTVLQESELLCDDVLPYGWYRFLAYGMSRKMATECATPGSCGTQAPVWLDTTTFNATWLDTTKGATVHADACVSWGFDAADYSDVTSDPHEVFFLQI